MKKFESMSEYEKWTDQFEDYSECEQIPILIDNGFEIKCDMLTYCKSWKTAVKRFQKAFKGYDEELDTWLETIQGSCESGEFQNLTGYYGAHVGEPTIEQIQE